MIRRRRVMAVLLLAIAPLPRVAGAQEQEGPEPVRYTLRFPRPAEHVVEVEASVPTDGKPDVEVLMAVWTPGSYLVREYARHVEGLVARDAGGKPLDVVKVREEPLEDRDRRGSSHPALIPR